MMRVSSILAFLAFAVFHLFLQPAAGQTETTDFDSITIAVRSDAAPFSYYNGSGAAVSDLESYSGYMVEICREVLTSVTSSGPFKGAEVIAIPVDASERFQPIETQGKADVLCGPTSITKDRLQRFNISIPVFLSGIALAQLNRELFPEALDCDQTILGYVTNTTAEDPGILRMTEDRFYFGRYTDAIKRIIELRDLWQDQLGNQGIVYQDFYNKFIEAELDSGYFGQVCSAQFSVPPIREFSSHSSGLDAICRGEILYYVADLGIISEYLRDHKSCTVELSRSVVLVENYGVFFRLPIDEGTKDEKLKTLILFSEFGRNLMIQLRQGEGTFRRAYKATFGERPASSALQDFFRASSFGLQ